MNMSKYYLHEEEKPLDQIPEDGGFCRIFRKIGCIGDSLSSGEFEIRKADGKSDYFDMYEYSWGQHIARKTGSAVYNFSKGGMTAQDYCEYFADNFGYWNPEKACQAYIIALGVNDKNGYPKEMGNLEDIDLTDYNNNKPTFAGYYGKIIQRLKEIQPRAKFFLVTMPRDDDSGKYDIKERYNNCIREIANYFDNTYLIDLHTYAPAYDELFVKKFYLEGHMSPAGYVFTADIIAAYIDYIIRQNMDDFKEIGFIGTQIINYSQKVAENVVC